MKKITLTLAAVALAGGLMAQDNLLSAGLELAVPVGDLADVTTLGYGASVGFEVPVNDNLGVMAQVGYLMFSGKDYDLGIVTVEGPNWSMIPAQVGAKYYFTDAQEGLYAFGLVGIHNTSYTTPSATSTVFGVTVTSPEVKVSSTDLSFAPGVGYIIGENIDLGLRYQIISGDGGSTSYLGVRAAYMFGL